MKIQIRNFKSNNQKTGYVATFDVAIEDVGVVRNITLIRPEKKPSKAWLRYPSLSTGGKIAFWLSPTIRDEAGRRAAIMYEAASGVQLTYDPPPGIHAGEDRQEEPAEEDDAGLRRVIGETLERAGL